VAGKERAGAVAKLGNSEFLARRRIRWSPKIKTRLAAAEEELARIEAALAALPAS